MAVLRTIENATDPIKEIQKISPVVIKVKIEGRDEIHVWTTHSHYKAIWVGPQTLNIYDLGLLE